MDRKTVFYWARCGTIASTVLGAILTLVLLGRLPGAMAFAGLISLGLTFWVITWGARKLDDLEEITLGRSLSEHILDLGTDIIIAVFISSCVAMLIIGVSSEETLKEVLKEPLKEHFKESFKEIFIAGSVALVSFGTLLVLRASLLVQRQLRTNKTLQKAEKLLMQLQELERDAVVVTAEAGAGSALASVLKQDKFFEHENPLHAPDRSSRQLTRAERLHVLSAAGRCAEYWVAFALRKSTTVTPRGMRADAPKTVMQPESNGSGTAEGSVNFASVSGEESHSISDREPFEKAMVKLTAAKEFLREAASDIARSNRLAISNIRYVTSLVCSALITIGNLPNPQKTDGKVTDWRPVWLALTTYGPQLWFDDTGHFLQNTGLTSGTVHIQYWGRYLRLLRYLMAEQPAKGSKAGAKQVKQDQREAKGNEERQDQEEQNQETLDLAKPAPICIRVFGLREENPDKGGEAIQKFNDSKVFGSMFPLPGKLTYMIPPRHTPPTTNSFPRDIALALAADAADAVTHAATLSTRSGGQLEKWLLDVKKIRPDPENPDLTKVTEVMKRWHDQHRDNISNFIRSSWEKMHAWELEYFSAVQRQGKIGAPRISNPRNTRRVIQMANVGIELSFVDGNPLEVMLDALLMYSEAQEPDAFQLKDAREVFVDRWHKPVGAHAYYAGESEPEPGPTQSNEKKVTDLLKAMTANSDIHAFGFAPVDGDKVLWGKAQWLMAMKSQMSASLGMARVDFLELDEQGTVSLTEVQDPDGEKTTDSRIALSDVVNALASRKESQDFERFK
jgi:hypothetical protein